jgi:hypothetical protein
VRIPSASRYILSASGGTPAGTEVFVAEALCRFQDPDAPTPGEKCGLKTTRTTDDRKGSGTKTARKSQGSAGGKGSGGNFKNDPERAAEAGRKGGKS